MRAVHIVQQWHLDGYPKPFEEQMEGVKVAVCNAGLDVAQMQERVPNTLFLPSVDATTVPKYGNPKSVHAKIRNGMGEWLQAGTHDIVSRFGAYDDYANLIVEHLGHWPGLYIDLCWISPPYWWIQQNAHDPHEIENRWPKLRDYFLERLWDLWPQGSAPVFIPNIGGEFGEYPEPIDGFSLESDHIEPEDKIVHVGRLVLAVRDFQYIIAWRPKDPDAPPIMDPDSLTAMGILDGLRI